MIHGIFAITMTLLVLDLRLPSPPRHGRLLEDLIGMMPQAGAYLYGFLYLTATWLSVRQCFRVIHTFDRVVTLLLLGNVALISLTPFTVSLVAGSADSEGDLGVAVRLMALVVGVAYALSGLLLGAGAHR